MNIIECSFSLFSSLGAGGWGVVWGNQIQEGKQGTKMTINYEEELVSISSDNRN